MWAGLLVFGKGVLDSTEVPTYWKMLELELFVENLGYTWYSTRLVVSLGINE
jgi:hypothetical protein